MFPNVKNENYFALERGSMSKLDKITFMYNSTKPYRPGQPNWEYTMWKFK